MQTIGKDAFNTTALTSVTIPPSVTTIGNTAFFNCKNLREVTICNNITSTENSVTTIGESAFSLCSAMTTLTIGNSVISIGNGAFSWCEELTSLTIGNSVQTIDDAAFLGCISLDSVKIPDSVTSIGSAAFQGCTSLDSVKIPASLTSIGSAAFQGCTALRSIVTGDFVRTLGKEAFKDCTSLTSAIIGNSVEAIGEFAFSGCSRLSSLTIGNSVTSIGKYAFSGCKKLSAVTLSPSVETIRESAFAGNAELWIIVMGHRVQTIDEKAFDGCPADYVVVTAKTPPEAFNNTFSNYYNGKLILQGNMLGYSISSFCWCNFNKLNMRSTINPTELKVEGDRAIIGAAGDTFELSAKLYPENITLPYVFWRSTNPEIATVDCNGKVTLRAGMNDCDDASALPCKIIAETLYTNGPVAEFTVNDTTGGVFDVIDTTESSDDIDFTSPVEVYNLRGEMISDSVENLKAGIYIIRQGNIVRKHAVK